MSVCADRVEYHDPYHGSIRGSYRGRGEFPLNEATSSGLVRLGIKLRSQRFEEDMVELWHPRRFAEFNPGVKLIPNDWDRYTDPQHHSFVSPASYTTKHVFPHEYRLCNRHAAKGHEDGDNSWQISEDASWTEKVTVKKDASVGVEVLNSTYEKELELDLAECQRRSDDTDFVRRTFLHHVFSRHSEGVDTNSSESMIECLTLQYQNMTDEYADEDDGDTDATTETDPDCTHGRVIDQRDSGDVFSVMQVTVRLQRREGFFFLNADLSQRPPMVVAEVNGAPPIGRYRALKKTGYSTDLPYEANSVVGAGQSSAKQFVEGWEPVDSYQADSVIRITESHMVEKPRAPGTFFKFGKTAAGRWLDMSEGRRGFMKLEDPIHVYVITTILNIPSINSASSTVTVKLDVAAYWKDPRMKDMWQKRDVKLTERGNLWAPNIHVVNADELEVNLESLRLINPKTGLIRADYSMQGTVHNVMSLRTFPLDSDIVCIEVQSYGQKQVEIHTGQFFRSDMGPYAQQAKLELEGNPLEEGVKDLAGTAIKALPGASKALEVSGVYNEEDVEKEYRAKLDKLMVRSLLTKVDKDVKEQGLSPDEAWDRGTDWSFFTREEACHIVGIKETKKKKKGALNKLSAMEEFKTEGKQHAEKSKKAKAKAKGKQGDTIANPMFAGGTEPETPEAEEDEDGAEVDKEWEVRILESIRINSSSIPF